VNVACYDAADGQLITSRDFCSLRIEDGFFGFNSARFRVDLFEFNIYEDGKATPVFAEDFSDPALSYALDSIDNPVWYASSTWNKSNLIAGNIGRLDISKPSSGVVYTQPVERQDSNQLYLLYTLGADFYVDEMEYADSGFIIGADENGNGGTFVGVRKTTDNVWAVSYGVGNEADATVCEDYISSSVVTLRAKVFYDNSVELTVGGHKYVFSAEQSAGYFGFKTFAYGSGECVGAYVDNFEYSANEYVKRTADDASVNFNDTIGTEIMGMTVYDYYCPTNAWYKASGLSLPIVVGQDGYLIFSNAGDYQCFAPKKKYNNFNN
jgi:acetone carboxylase gamma subunit